MQKILFQSRIRQFYVVLTVLFLLTACGETTEREGSGNEDSINAYMDLGLNAYDSSDYNISQLFFDSAHYLVNEKTDTSLRIKLLFNQTEILKLRGYYDTCLTNYYMAMKLAQETRDTARLALAYYNVASINFYLGQHQKCLENAEKSLELYSSEHNSAKIANCYVLMSIAMREMNSPESIDYLKLALNEYEKTGDTLNIGITYNNLGNYYLDFNDLKQANFFYEQAVRMNRSIKDNYHLALSYGNLGESYIDLGRMQEARMYIDSSLRMALRIEARETIELNYQRLGRYFEKIGDGDSALLMMSKLLEARTSRLRMEGDVLVETTEDKHKTQLSLLQSKAEVSQLEADKTRGRIVLWFVVVIALLSITVAYLFIRKQRQIRKIDLHLHEEEKKALEAETALKEHILQEQEAAQARLESELDFKRQELMKFSLTISEREEFLSSLRSLVQQISPTDTQKPEIIKEIRMMLNNGADDGKTELYRQINEMNQSFVFNLKSSYPSLNEDDIRLASLLLIDLSSKEIADILSIEAKSVDMKRYRLKKKLELDADTDLKAFLQQI